MVTRRAEEISPFLVMDVLDRARAMEHQGIDVVHLEVGEPNFGVPTSVKDAINRALEDGQTHHSHILGDAALRTAISDYYKETYGASVNSDQVVVTSGASPAMMLVFSALLEQGDEVIHSDPGHACYPNSIKFTGGGPVPVHVYE